MNLQEFIQLAYEIDSNHDHYALLFSSDAKKGDESVFAYNPIAISRDFASLSNELSIGYIGYEALCEIPNGDCYINMPKMMMSEYRDIVRHSHIKDLIFHQEKKCDVRAYDVRSNMTRNEYLNNVDTIKQYIRNGDIFQANLTRKFFGKIDYKCTYLDMFFHLCSLSPSRYSCFLKYGNRCIVSSSPERFLKIDESGRANTQPIKGTLSTKYDSKQLVLSKKDRAENLMIVDLMRNDMARGSAAGSVMVSELFKIRTFASIHHLHSTIRSHRNISIIDFIKNCFPPGSVTGAPKIRAIEICKEIEGIARGAYCGAMGWINGNKSCDLSVGIRNIIIHGNRFEFQVGGAITSDSNSEIELQEIYDKAAMICELLQYSIKALDI